MSTIDWLLEGDPVIRWQVMRDLLDEPEESWKPERDRVSKEGWGAQYLAAQGPEGNWPEGRWTSGVWTLCVLVDLGMPQATTGMSQGFERVVSRLMPPGEKPSHDNLIKNMDLCHLGFWLKIGAHFVPGDSRLKPLAETILSMQMADGGWNCRLRTKPKTSHGSFHTTFNVLEGLKLAAEAGIIEATLFNVAEAKAMEFALQHKCYRSDRTGEVISERFTHLAFPSYWHYTVLRGLDYIRQTSFIRDPRLQDPLDLIQSRRKTNGRWVVEKPIPGTVLVAMEKNGQDSRWNTLRALRVLKAAGRE